MHHLAIDYGGEEVDDAVDFLGMRAEVDPARIGIMGVSFHDAAYARTTSVGSTRQAHGLAPPLTSAMVTIECIESVLTQILSTIPQQHFWRDIHDNSSRQECNHV